MTPTCVAPNLDEVLAHVRPGRDTRLYLTDEQKRATADRDGLILRHVVRALVRARHGARHPKQPPDAFPLTPLALQAVARKLGPGHVGIKRAYALIARGRECGLLYDAGRYRARRRLAGDRLIPLYRLGARIAAGVCSAHKQPTVGRKTRVKRKKPPRWWLHPLLGDPSRRAPPGLSRRMRNARSHDERHPSRV